VCACIYSCVRVSNNFLIYNLCLLYTLSSLILTNREHAIRQITRHFTLDRVFNIFTSNLCISSKHSPEVGITPRYKYNIEPGFICAKLFLFSSIKEFSCILFCLRISNIIHSKCDAISYHIILYKFVYC